MKITRFVNGKKVEESAMTGMMVENAFMLSAIDRVNRSLFEKDEKLKKRVQDINE